MQISNANLQFAYENFQTRLQEVKNYILLVKKLADISSPAVSEERYIEKYIDDKLNSSLNFNSLFPIQRRVVDPLQQRTETDSLDWINGLTIGPQSTRRPTRSDFACHKIDRELQKTLRASTYLLLYNLMESTMSESINAIHETIRDENRNLLELSEKLHKVILQSFSKGLTNEKVSEFSRDNADIRDRIFDLGYDKKKLFSGNIDCGVIDEYCKKYDIRISPYKIDSQPLLWNPDKIEHIRKKRNSLAHGSESFAQCGQNMPIDSIDDNLQSVEAVLMGVFNGLNNFLTRQKYLRASQ